VENMQKTIHWSKEYSKQVERNIGYISYVDQERLRTTQIAVLGVGGLGGPLAEQLVRTGCERLVICDHDTFELSNLNRQICTREDIEKRKVDVLKEFLQKINPSVEVRPYYQITEDNIGEILNDVEIVVLSLDHPITSILVSRESRKRNIPMLESWAVPYVFGWWFTSESVDYETCYELPTQKMTISQIRESKNIQKSVVQTLIPKVMKFPEFKLTLDREPGIVSSMMAGEVPLRSLGPIVRLTASYLAFEVIYAGILEIKDKNLAPSVVGYDYLRMEPIAFTI